MCAVFTYTLDAGRCCDKHDVSSIYISIVSPLTTTSLFRVVLGQLRQKLTTRVLSILYIHFVYVKSPTHQRNDGVPVVMFRGGCVFKGFSTVAMVIIII